MLDRLAGLALLRVRCAFLGPAHRLPHPVGNLVRARPVEVLDEEVANDRSRIRIGADQFNHLVRRFLAQAGEGRTRRDGEVIAARGEVVDLGDLAHLAGLRVFLLLLNRLIDPLHVGLAVFTDDADHLGNRIDLRNEVDHDPAGVTDGAAQVVDEMERGVVALHLPGDDGLAGGLVRPRTEAGVIDAHHGLNVVGGVQRLLQGSSRHA